MASLAESKHCEPVQLVLRDLADTATVAFALTPPDEIRGCPQLDWQHAPVRTHFIVLLIGATGCQLSRPAI